MAEMAVKKTDNDPTISDASRWQAGDLVVACEDGHPWTDKEYENFIIVKMPGVPIEEARKWVQPKTKDMGDDGIANLRRSRCTYDHTTKKIVDKDDLDTEIYIEDLVGDHGHYGRLEEQYKVGRRQANGERKASR